MRHQPIKVATARVWDPGWGDEPEEPNGVWAFTLWKGAIVPDEAGPEKIAEAWCERRFSDDSYPQERDVLVRDGDSKEVYEINVETQSTPVFYAVAKKGKKVL